MSDSEKWARWTLGVVALTIAAYGAFLVFFGHGPAISSVFALLALTSIPASSRRYFRGRRLDEREREKDESDRNPWLPVLAALGVAAIVGIVVYFLAALLRVSFGVG